MQPLVLFVLPNIILIGAIQFTIGVLARQVIPDSINAPSQRLRRLHRRRQLLERDRQSTAVHTRRSILEINAFLAMSRYWTRAELETRLVGVPADAGAGTV